MGPTRYLKPSAILAVLLAAPAQGALLTQVDTFEGGSRFGWGSGAQAITITTSGGPAGGDDGFLQYSSSGIDSSNGRMVIPNESFENQWSGDYAAAGVTDFLVDVFNRGVPDLHMRVAIANIDTWFVSSAATIVPSSDDWTPVSFRLAPDAMTRVGAGAGDFDTVIRDVTRVRLLSSVDLPPVSFGGVGGVQGDVVAASIGIDNFRAEGVPEPTGLGASTLLVALLAGGRHRAR